MVRSAVSPVQAVNEKAPAVRDVADQICDEADQKEAGVCIMENKAFYFEEDTIFERSDLTKMILKNTEIRCSTAEQAACSFTLKLSHPEKKIEISILENSVIRGQSIFIAATNGRLIIDGTSMIETNGRSDSDEGSGKKNQQGASFIGQGGHCGKGI